MLRRETNETKGHMNSLNYTPSEQQSIVFFFGIRVPSAQLIDSVIDNYSNVCRAGTRLTRMELRKLTYVVGSPGLSIQILYAQKFSGIMRKVFEYSFYCTPVAIVSLVTKNGRDLFCDRWIFHFVMVAWRFCALTHHSPSHTAEKKTSAVCVCIFNLAHRLTFNSYYNMNYLICISCCPLSVLCVCLDCFFFSLFFIPFSIERKCNARERKNCKFFSRKNFLFECFDGVYLSFCRLLKCTFDNRVCFRCLGKIYIFFAKMTLNFALYPWRIVANLCVQGGKVDDAAEGPFPSLFQYFFSKRRVKTSSDCRINERSWIRFEVNCFTHFTHRR